MKLETANVIIVDLQRPLWQNHVKEVIKQGTMIEERLDNVLHGVLMSQMGKPSGRGQYIAIELINEFVHYVGSFSYQCRIAKEYKRLLVRNNRKHYNATAEQLIVSKHDYQLSHCVATYDCVLYDGNMNLGRFSVPPQDRWCTSKFTEEVRSIILEDLKAGGTIEEGFPVQLT